MKRQSQIIYSNITAVAVDTATDGNIGKYFPIVLKDDEGNAFELSPDPLLDTVCPVVANIKLGEAVNVEEILQPILTKTEIFGVDLYEVGMAQIVCDYFGELIAGPGAVRATLEKYVG